MLMVITMLRMFMSTDASSGTASGCDRSIACQVVLLGLVVSCMVTMAMAAAVAVMQVVAMLWLGTIWCLRCINSGTDFLASSSWNSMQVFFARSRTKIWSWSIGILRAVCDSTVLGPRHGVVD